MIDMNDIIFRQNIKDIQEDYYPRKVKHIIKKKKQTEKKTAPSSNDLS